MARAGRPPACEAIAPIAPENKPQYLEILGVVVK